MHWPDEAACEAFAARVAVAPTLWPRTQIALDGPLGAGKTTFVRHLLRALGVTGRIKSPTFAVMEPYDLPQGAVSHFDFYRFGDAREWIDAGFRDVFAADGLTLVEWPEKAAAVMPTPDLLIALEPASETVRQVQVQAFTTHGQTLCLQLFSA